MPTEAVQHRVPTDKKDAVADQGGGGAPDSPESRETDALPIQDAIKGLKVALFCMLNRLSCSLAGWAICLASRCEEISALWINWVWRMALAQAKTRKAHTPMV